MTAVALPDRRGTISRLWTDKNSRAVLMQIIVMAGLFAFLAFVVNNVIGNLEALGKTFGFAFLEAPASYDINQTLIDYDSRDSHFRAGLVGVLNTLLIAACGIVLATIVGFTLGILRLSSNWLVNRIVYCYIEFTRNIPLLVQILLWHGVLVNTLPRTKNAYEVSEGFFLTNRGFFIPRPEFEAGFVAVIIAFVIGLGFTIWFYRWAHRVQEATGKIYPVLWVSLGAVLGLPILVYFLAGSPITWEFPVLKGFNFRGGLALKPEFTALWLALSLYTAAFIAEIVRAGIQAVSHGQTEAARALGMRPNRTLQLIIIPQALRVIIPPLTSQYLNLTKNSSLAIAIGYMDIVATVGGITLNQTGKEMECMIIVMGLYLSFSLLISLFMNWYNKKMALVER